MVRRRRRGPDRAAGREDELSECALLSRDERDGRNLYPIDAAIIALVAGRSLAAFVGWTYFFAVELNAPHALSHRQLPSSCFTRYIPRRSGHRPRGRSTCRTFDHIDLHIVGMKLGFHSLFIMEETRLGQPIKALRVFIVYEIADRVGRGGVLGLRRHG
jgi:hypothetical protein